MNFDNAILGVGREVYIIHDDVIVGVGQVVTFNGYCDYGVKMIDDSSREFFKGYEIPELLGFRGTFWHYDEDGNPSRHYEDEPEDFHKGTKVVDKIAFDFGFCPEQFKSVEGCGKSND